LGERYEQAVELAWSAADDQARATGLTMLADLGATAALELVQVHIDEQRRDAGQ
jgi:hypothetical protein